MLVDVHGRKITYLRVSVTDRCNLRCRYCIPEQGVQLKEHRDLMTFEEIEAVVRAAVELGVRRVRLTGGEPLLRRDLDTLVAKLAAIPNLADLALTTNGVLFGPAAAKLKRAGLKRVNISLDTLKPERFKAMSGSGDWQKVVDAVEAALREGYHPVKLNVVVVGGHNDDEVEDFVRFAKDRPLELRFIEFMPFGNSFWDHTKSVKSEEVKKRAGRAAKLVPLKNDQTAETYSINGSQATVGFISPLSQPFCNRCNRLRLTADGFLRPCLADQAEVDIKTPVRHGMAGTALRRLFYEALRLKAVGHHFNQGQRDTGRLMAELGG